MKISKRSIVLVLSLSFWLPAISLAQDTLKIFRFPPIDQIDVIIGVRVTATGGKYRYQYEIKSLQTSKQEIWVIDMPFDTPPSNIHSPQGWIFDVGGKVATIQWGARRAVHFIRPSQTLSGFGYDSEGLPTIRRMYLEGWAEPPELTFEPDSTIGGDVLEDSKKVLTIGATKTPADFNPMVWLDTLISYKHQAFALGWIKNQGIVTSLDAKLENAKRQLQRNNKTAAKNTLQAFVNEMEALNKQGNQITSEAYALLKFNAEYLISKL